MDDGVAPLGCCCVRGRFVANQSVVGFDRHRTDKKEQKLETEENRSSVALARHTMFFVKIEVILPQLLIIYTYMYEGGPIST